MLNYGGSIISSFPNTFATSPAYITCHLCNNIIKESSYFGNNGMQYYNGAPTSAVSNSNKLEKCTHCGCNICFTCFNENQESMQLQHRKQFDDDENNLMLKQAPNEDIVFTKSQNHYNIVKKEFKEMYNYSKEIVEKLHLLNNTIKVEEATISEINMIKHQVNTKALDLIKQINNEKDDLIQQIENVKQKYEATLNERKEYYALSMQYKDELRKVIRKYKDYKSEENCSLNDLLKIYHAVKSITKSLDDYDHIKLIAEQDPLQVKYEERPVYRNLIGKLLFDKKQFDIKLSDDMHNVNNNNNNNNNNPHSHSNGNSLNRFSNSNKNLNEINANNQAKNSAKEQINIENLKENLAKISATSGSNKTKSTDSADNLANTNTYQHVENSCLVNGKQNRVNNSNNSNGKQISNANGKDKCTLNSNNHQSILKQPKNTSSSNGSQAPSNNTKSKKQAIINDKQETLSENKEVSKSFSLNDLLNAANDLITNKEGALNKVRNKNGELPQLKVENSKMNSSINQSLNDLISSINDENNRANQLGLSNDEASKEKSFLVKQLFQGLNYVQSTKNQKKMKNEFRYHSTENLLNNFTNNSSSDKKTALPSAYNANNYANNAVHNQQFIKVSHGPPVTNPPLPPSNMQNLKIPALPTPPTALILNQKQVVATQTKSHSQATTEMSIHASSSIKTTSQQAILNTKQQTPSQKSLTNQHYPDTQLQKQNSQNGMKSNETSNQQQIAPLILPSLNNEIIEVMENFRTKQTPKQRLEIDILPSHLNFSNNKLLIASSFGKIRVIDLFSYKIQKDELKNILINGICMPLNADTNEILYAVTNGEMSKQNDLLDVSNAIIIVTKKELKVLKKENSNQNDDYSFLNPGGICFDQYDNIYVCDSGNNRVKVFDSNLGLIATIDQASDNGIDNLSQPKSVTTYKDTLFVCDSANHRIVSYSILNNGSEFKYKYSYGSGYGDGPGMLRYPLECCVDNFGILYVRDHHNSRVQLFGIDTKPFHFIEVNSQRETIYSMTVTENGDIYVAKMVHIQETDQSGVINTINRYYIDIY